MTTTVFGNVGGVPSPRGIAPSNPQMRGGGTPPTLVKNESEIAGVRTPPNKVRLPFTTVVIATRHSHL